MPGTGWLVCGALAFEWHTTCADEVIFIGAAIGIMKAAL